MLKLINFSWIFGLVVFNLSLGYADTETAATVPPMNELTAQADAVLTPLMNANTSSPETAVKNAMTNESTNEDDIDDEAAGANVAIGMASIQGTAEGSPVEGEADFVETAEGLSINIEVFNVPNPGKHGIHLHENGSCADSGKAAGGHYNPDNVQHGMVMKDGHEKAHAGDLGNIEIKEDGSGSLSVFLSDFGLNKGKYNVAGKAVVLHEKEDDFSQPTGNAGGRIGCGVIEVAE